MCGADIWNTSDCFGLLCMVTSKVIKTVAAASVVLAEEEVVTVVIVIGISCGQNIVEIIHYSSSKIILQ